MTMTLMALSLACAALAQGPAADAQRRYDAGDYTGAATAFAKLAAAHPREPAWHYDLGNALFKAGRLGPAVASYQRSFNLAPRDADIIFNLDFALSRAGEDIVPAGMPPLLYWLFHGLSDSELAGLHWAGCWAALLLGATWLLRRDHRRQLLTPWTTTALAVWIGAGAWWGARRWLEPSSLGVIIKSTAELRNGPGEGFSVSFTVPEGRRVEIFSDEGAWLEVGVAKEAAKGWVKAADIEKI